MDVCQGDKRVTDQLEKITKMFEKMDMRNKATISGFTDISKGFPKACKEIGKNVDAII